MIYITVLKYIDCDNLKIYITYYYRKNINRRIYDITYITTWVLVIMIEGYDLHYKMVLDVITEESPNLYVSWS